MTAHEFLPGRAVAPETVLHQLGVGLQWFSASQLVPFEFFFPAPESSSPEACPSPSVWNHQLRPGRMAAGATLNGTCFRLRPHLWNADCDGKVPFAPHLAWPLVFNRVRAESFRAHLNPRAIEAQVRPRTSSASVLSLPVHTAIPPWRWGINRIRKAWSTWFIGSVAMSHPVAPGAEPPSGDSQRTARHPAIASHGPSSLLNRSVRRVGAQEF